MRIKQSTYKVTVSLMLHAPGHHHFTVAPIHRHSVPPCRHVTRRPSHRAIIPPCHFPPTYCNRFAVTPGALPCHHCATVQPGAPPWHLSFTVPPFRRSTDTTHRHTSVHPRTWHTSRRTWQMSIIPPDTVWRNFTIWSVAKIAMTTLMGFFRKTMGFPINVSQYCAIRKSTISHNEEVNG